MPASSRNANMPMPCSSAPGQRVGAITPNTRVYTASNSNGVSSDHTEPNNDPRYRPLISRQVRMRISAWWRTGWVSAACIESGGQVV